MRLLLPSATTAHLDMSRQPRPVCLPPDYLAEYMHVAGISTVPYRLASGFLSADPFNIDVFCANAGHDAICKAIYCIGRRE